MADTPDDRTADQSPRDDGDTDEPMHPAAEDPIILPGAGGPVGGPVAGEVVDVLNQPLISPAPAPDDDDST